MNQKIKMVRFTHPTPPSADERESIRANELPRKGKLQATHAQLPLRCHNRICAFRRLFADALPILMN